MSIAENDDGFASCEEDDGVDKTTGDPIHDHYLQLKKIQSKEERSKILVKKTFRVHFDWQVGSAQLDGNA
jgi:hypothetical protein